MKQFIIFILLVAVLISWIYHYKVVEKQHVDYSREMETLEKKYYEKTEKNDFALFTLKEDMRVCMQNEGLRIGEKLMVSDEKQEAVLLQQVFQKNTLVVRISQANCQVCVEAVMPLLKKSGIQQIVILGDYTNKRFFRKMKELHEVDFRCFKTEESFHLPIDDLNIPYLFATDKNLLVSNLFIPHKEMLEQTELYLSIISERL